MKSSIIWKEIFLRLRKGRNVNEGKETKKANVNHHECLCADGEEMPDDPEDWIDHRVADAVEALDDEGSSGEEKFEQYLGCLDVKTRSASFLKKETSRPEEGCQGLV